MKSINKVILLSVSIGLSACNVKKTEYTPPDIKVDTKGAVAHESLFTRNF